MKRYLLGSLFLTLSACSVLEPLIAQPEPIKFVSNLSEGTSFSIIPFNDTLGQANYASLIQSVFIESGLNVVVPKILNKEVEERKSGQAGSNDSDNQAQVGMSSTERYKATEISGTDYIVETAWSGYSGTAKITRSKDKKIMGVYSVDSYEPSKIGFQKELEKLSLIKRAP